MRSSVSSRDTGEFLKKCIRIYEDFCLLPLRLNPKFKTRQPFSPLITGHFYVNVMLFHDLISSSWFIFFSLNCY